MEDLKSFVNVIVFIVCCLALYGLFKIITGVMSWAGVGFCVGTSRQDRVLASFTVIHSECGAW